MDLLDDSSDNIQDIISNLEINGTDFDLTNKSEAYKALDTIRDFRQQLRDGELEEYEDKGTEFGDGGRTQMLYDEIRAHMAVGFHQGDHDLTWQEQHEEAENIISIRAAKTMHLWKNK